MPTTPLNVLMISLGDEVLTGWGDTRERHVEYAERINHLHIVAYSPRKHRLSETALSDHLTVYPTRSATRASFVLDATLLGAKICRQRPIDVITTQDPFATGLVGLLLKRRFKIPLQLQNHSDFFDNRYWIQENPLRYGLFNRVGKWILRYGDVHRVLNQAEKDKYVKMGIRPDRVVVLAIHVRLQRFSPDGPPNERFALRNRLGIPPKAPVLFWAGQPAPVKRVHTLIEAFARVVQQFPDARLVLAGDFLLYPDIPAQVGRLGLSQQVVFLGNVPHEDLPAYYRLCDVYVHSSIYEGLGRVLVEAAACARPVVSTRTAGAQEIILQGKTGLLCKLDDPQDLAAKVCTVLEHPDQAAKMGAAAREFVLQKFDHIRNIEGVVAAWEQAAALKGKA